MISFCFKLLFMIYFRLKFPIPFAEIDTAKTHLDGKDGYYREVFCWPLITGDQDCNEAVDGYFE